MVRRVLIVLCFAFMTVWMAGCGQTYKLVSINATPNIGYNLETPGQTGPLTVTATYSNSKTNIVTMKSKYQISDSSAPNNAAPLSINSVPTLTVNESGIVQASGTVGACTWTSSTPTGSTTAAYAQFPYAVKITYTEAGVTVSTSTPISVATAFGCYDGTGHMPPS